MRERTTWNRARIASHLRKVAEDPRAMNQDHHAQQPGADEYVIGGPSDFAEDVHPSSQWGVEQDPEGNTQRNGIGLPAFREDTFKGAALDVDAVNRKAFLATKIARAMLPKTASEALVEDQAFSLMAMDTDALTDTLVRLASDEDEDEDEDEGQDKQAQDQQQAEGQDQQQAEGQDKQAQDQQQAEGQGQQQAEGQDKQASTLAQQLVQAQQQGNVQAQQQILQAMQQQLAQQMQQAQDQQQAEGQGKQAPTLAQQLVQAQQQGNVQAQQQILQAMQQQLAQQMQQAQDQQLAQQMQQAQGQQLAQAQGVSEDELVAQMFQGQDQLDDYDIEMEAPVMDVDTQLEPDDDALQQIFASNTEVQQAMEATALTGGHQVQASAGMARTASTRTVGTRPPSGVSRLGGATASSGGDGINQLSGLWKTDPDVSSVFR